MLIIECHFAFKQSMPRAGSCCWPMAIFLCMQAAQMRYCCASSETCKRLDMSEAARMCASSNLRHCTPHGCPTDLHLANMDNFRHTQKWQNKVFPDLTQPNRWRDRTKAKQWLCCKIKSLYWQLPADGKAQTCMLTEASTVRQRLYANLHEVTGIQ